MNTVYNTLYKARQSRGLTQTDLSNLLQLGQSYVSQLERGKHDIKLSTLVDWARVLDLELMLIPRKNVQAVAFLISSASGENQDELPAAYGPLPDDVD